MAISPRESKQNRSSGIGRGGKRQQRIDEGSRHDHPLLGIQAYSRDEDYQNLLCFRVHKAVLFLLFLSLLIARFLFFDTFLHLFLASTA
jgi:hypothetical protein